MDYIVLVIGVIVLFVLIFNSFISEDNNSDYAYLSEEEENDDDKETEETEETEDKKEIDNVAVKDKPDLKLVKVEQSVGTDVREEETDTESKTEPVMTTPSEVEKKDKIESNVTIVSKPQSEKGYSEKPKNNVVVLDNRNAAAKSNIEEEKQVSSKQAEVTRIQILNKSSDPNPSLLEVGSEEDLRLRLELKKGIAKPVSQEKTKAVAVVVQLRFPDDVIRYSNDFVDILTSAEKVFEKPFSFPFNTYQTTQFNRIWIFEPTEDRDIIIEALIDAFELTVRFRKLLENTELLRENKVKIAIGVSMGEITFVNRGVSCEPSLIGKPVYLAETLADIVNDFGIYVDSIIRTSTIPIFDFKEWRPTVVRSNLPAIPLYELVGWNKPSEIASYVKNEDPVIRKAVAIAYRYLELEDLHPLVELLRDRDRGVVNSAIRTVCYIGNDKMNGALKLLMPEAVDPDLKSKIIECFGNAGNSSVLPVVLASTRENSWKVRLAATKALYQLGGGNALEHLEPMLKDEDSIVRIVANSIFYNETNKLEYFNVLINGLRDVSKRSRATAIECLLAIGSDEALKEVTSAFSNQEIDLQKHILTKMINNKSKILYQCLLTIFKKSSEALRPYIVEVIRQAGIVS